MIVLYAHIHLKKEASMFAPTVLSLFEEALHHIKNDEGNILAVNPAIIFDQKLKNGEFSHLKD